MTGDSELSTSTEVFGPLDEEFIIYEVRWRISQSGISRLNLTEGNVRAKQLEANKAIL